MLGDITVADEIYVICGYTDMRKSIDGLCAVVKDQLNMNPSRPNAIYLFCGRRSDRIKVLLHEREGFVLLYKRLDANVGKYRWPRNRNEVKPITWRQFDWLMSGLETEQPKAIKNTGNAFPLALWYNWTIEKERKNNAFRSKGYPALRA